jgi:hypothetical protein
MLWSFSGYDYVAGSANRAVCDGAILRDVGKELLDGPSGHLKDRAVTCVSGLR